MGVFVFFFVCLCKKMSQQITDTKPRTRVNVTSIVEGSDTYNKLADAFRKMKALPPSDTNSFFNLASYHGFERDVCWHGSELFLNWHRKYILMFENALRAVAGDDSISLPYFKAEEDKELPEWLFKDPFDHFELPDVDGIHGKFAQYLGQFLSHYGYKTFREGHGDPNQREIIRNSLKASNLPATIDYFMREGTWKGIGVFGLEGPHGTIHVDVGGWMGRVPIAAFDPIFWMHHCNVERWLCKWQIEYKAKTVDAMNAISGTDDLSPHVIPWDLEFTGVDERNRSHANSFEGSMRETVWYDFVKYDDLEAQDLPRPAFSLSANLRPRRAGKESSIESTHSIAIKVNRKNIDGSFRVLVFYTKDGNTIKSKFGVFQAGAECANCQANPVVMVSGPVPSGVEFPCGIKVEIRNLDDEIIPPETAPRKFNVRLLIKDENE